MARVDLMRIWFEAWNADVRASIDDYDRTEASALAGKVYADPDWCRNQVHRRSPENIVPGTKGQCLDCRNAADRARRYAKEAETEAA